jgi:pimeloyl-ACP methyl ester carboxylesterase
VKQQHITTHDGGQLALYSYGTQDAPGRRRIVVIGGAFLTALIYRPFSEALSEELGDGWAVDVYDRRGRGDSSPQPDGYSMATEIADVRTIMDATGARNIFGHSLGGSVALNAVQEFAGTSHVPEKLAVYDAAVNIDGSIATSWLDDFERSVNAGNVPHALAKLKRGMQPGTALAKIPEPILAGLMALVSRTTVNRVFRELMPSGVGELKAVFAEADHARDFSGLPPNTRFMVGAKSPRYYKVTAQLLHQAVPGSALQISPKCVHASIPTAVKTLVADISGYFKG